MLKTRQPDLAIQTFWNLFNQNQARLAALTSADDPLYDNFLKKLQKIDPGLSFELSIGPDEHEFIITAEGNSALFDLVDVIVQRAPNLEGWKILALKPQNGFPVRVGWMGFSLDTARVYFVPLEKEDSAELGLELLVPGLNEADIDRCHNALLRAIDYGLGERRFAEKIAGTIVTSIGLNTVVNQGIPLLKLNEFITWHENLRRPGKPGS